MQQSSLDSKTILLIVVILAATGLTAWRPWVNPLSKTIEVIGEGTVRAFPDKYSFNPTFQETAETALAATDAVTKKGNAVVAEFKNIGVVSDDIATNLTTYPNYSPVQSSTPSFNAVYTITATVTDQALAEKLVAYIATTGATSNLTPIALFNDETRNKLELEARQKALDSSKQKAEQTAKAMGVRLGKIISISDSVAMPKPYPLYSTTEDAVLGDTGTKSSAPVTIESSTFQTGKQDIFYSVSVTYRYY